MTYKCDMMYNVCQCVNCYALSRHLPSRQTAASWCKLTSTPPYINNKVRLCHQVCQTSDRSNLSCDVDVKDTFIPVLLLTIFSISMDLPRLFITWCERILQFGIHMCTLTKSNAWLFSVKSCRINFILIADTHLCQFAKLIHFFLNSRSAQHWNWKDAYSKTGQIGGGLHTSSTCKVRYTVSLT